MFISLIYVQNVENVNCIFIHQPVSSDFSMGAMDLSTLLGHSQQEDYSSRRI